MIEFEEYEGKILDLQPRLETLGTALKLDDARRQADELEAESATDGFWNDISRSQKVQQQLKQLKTIF